MRTAVAVDTADLSYETVAASLRTIARNLREADAAEIAASTALGPEETLLQGWAASDRAWIIADRDDQPIGVFGVAPSAAPGIGVVWMLGTAGVEREGLSIARQTRDHLNEMHALYPTLWNFIDARNELSINWLLRSGFHLIDADAAYGPEKRLFYEFARMAHV